MTFLIEKLKICFKKSFYGLVKLLKQRSRQYGGHGNTSDISFANLQFWDFREFTIGNRYTALADSQRQNLIIGGQVL